MDDLDILVGRGDIFGAVRPGESLVRLSQAVHFGQFNVSAIVVVSLNILLRLLIIRVLRRPHHLQSWILRRREHGFPLVFLALFPAVIALACVVISDIIKSRKCLPIDASKLAELLGATAVVLVRK